MQPGPFEALRTEHSVWQCAGWRLHGADDCRRGSRKAQRRRCEQSKWSGHGAPGTGWVERGVVAVRAGSATCADDKHLIILRKGSCALFQEGRENSALA